MSYFYKPFLELQKVFYTSFLAVRFLICFENENFVKKYYRYFSFRSIMPPKNKDKNQSKPEKCAELKEVWAEHLPLKYDDKTYGDRFGIQFFVENFNYSSVLENSFDLDDDILQIFDVFCLMAFNSLKTENDINDLRAKAASGKTKNAKSNATMDYRRKDSQLFLGSCAGSHR